MSTKKPPLKVIAPAELPQSPAFKKLNERPETSKAEVVMVGVRMTRAERRNLRAIAAELEMPIQDILREGFALFKAKRNLK